MIKIRFCCLRNIILKKLMTHQVNFTLCTEKKSRVILLITSTWIERLGLSRVANEKGLMLTTVRDSYTKFKLSPEKSDKQIKEKRVKSVSSRDFVQLCF